MNYHAAKAFILDKLQCELSPTLTYHGIHHTLDVLYATEELCYFEKVAPYEQMLLKTAALFHDAGFTVSNLSHEQHGCDLAKSILPNYGYQPGEINRICGMILATKIPQQPKNHLEAIICDADLDYLGRDDFFTIGQTLFAEFKHYKVIADERSWNRLQVSFLQNHHFFTETSKRRRAPKKAAYLTQLKAIVANY